MDFLNLSGGLTHVRSVMDKNHVVLRAGRFFVLDRTMSAYERFCEGLQTLDVLTTIQGHPVCCREAFIAADSSVLTAAKLRHLFRAVYSEEGSNSRRREEKTAGFWMDYLLDAEEEEAQCTCKDILVFASGASSIPIIGFSDQPKIEFLNDDARFPTANTCSIILRLPTKFEEYNEFRDAMDFGILNAQSFGLA
ncbi:G2/M phase-specific E3 ubiquitin-protein ligase-like [Anneissia japonica]|uniref:G2/M phase-specific E3 ubiquitin-protein ligase-like n=1 Tax=Anneissia japonica TaxID=1529436 RepID=UPI00142571CD|nr:G2/M phase-specific E3 ubiquitin-protein ligase-like [Anneissia japonica]